MPLELLERAITQHLKLLHIGYIELVMFVVYIISYGGDVIVEPLEVGRLRHPARVAGTGAAFDIRAILGQHRRTLHPDLGGIVNDQFALATGQDLRDRDRREDLLFEFSFFICSVHFLSPFTAASNAFLKA